MITEDKPCCNPAAFKSFLHVVVHRYVASGYKKKAILEYVKKYTRRHKFTVHQFIELNHLLNTLPVTK